MGFFSNMFTRGASVARRGGGAAGRGAVAGMDAMASAGGIIDAGLAGVGERLGTGMVGSMYFGPKTIGGRVLGGLSRGADFLASNAYARNAALGGVAGGVMGGMSDDGSVLGGAFKGAALGAASTKGFRMLHKSLGARMARQGAASAAKIGAPALASNVASNAIRTAASPRINLAAKRRGRGRDTSALRPAWWQRIAAAYKGSSWGANPQELIRNIARGY